MTYHEIVELFRQGFDGADASAIQNHLAVQIDIYGEGEGALYLEVRDGKIDIQPYEYYDRDALFITPADMLLNIANGSIAIADAFASSRTQIVGNVPMAYQLTTIILKERKGNRTMKFAIDPQAWKKELPAFHDAAHAFIDGTMSRNEYKGISGRYGSYAQKGTTKSMIRLRMPAGRVTQNKLAFVARSIRENNVDTIHFTTCQAIQLHNLDIDPTVFKIMEEALDEGIVTLGGGGDFPRNTMCSPLTGTEVGEYFDVLPYAEAAGEYALNILNMQKMPRKLKVCFSNSPKNIPHATYRDLGFVARPDGNFDVYSAGGLGNNPKFGVKVAENVEPSKILYYIKAMYDTFCAHGNYQNRGKARTRYMQDICGGPDKYKEAYLEKLAAVMASGEDLDLEVEPITFAKTGDGSTAEGNRIFAQKQDGLYTVAWHPIGGKPSPEKFCEVADAVCKLQDAELRIAPDETAYIINLTGKEAMEMAALTAGDAESLFDTSVSCIGASICQVGLRDSQALLASCLEAVRAADLPDGALPQIHISGCPSSCGTHQTGALGFRGAAKKVDGVNKIAFMFYVGGCDREGAEKMGREMGTVVDTDIPALLVKLGKTVAASGKTYAEWYAADPNAIDAVAAEFI